VRATVPRVKRYRDADVLLRWTAAGFLQAQKLFRKIQGIKGLWVLKAALGRTVNADGVDRQVLAA
jgi:putative transposase